MSIDPARLGDLTGRVVFFPVRHHSPTAARLLRDLAVRLRPAAVLVELPSDFNPYLDELYLPHRPPIAIYSHVHLGDERRGGFYPLCEHSPEWQAVQVAREVGAAVRLIDLPWADIAALDADETSNRFTDAAFRRSAYIDRLCRTLGVDDFNTLWDTLFEIDPDLSVEAYLARCHQLCGHMRLLEAPGRLADRSREAFMAGEVRAAAAAAGDRPLLVVVGGAHCLPLYARWHGLDLGEMTAPAAFTPAAPLPEEERGVALTPYSFERLDALVGYEAGMPNPGFYQQLWHDRTRGRTDTHRTLLGRIVGELRDKRQPISAADVIAAETAARALAALRGHARVWRTDLVDGLTTSFVKEELNRAGRHPLLQAAHHVLRGGERGLLAAGTRLPPLVRDLHARLREHDLEPQPLSREIELVLDAEADLPRSRVLHRVRLLGIAGYERSGGSDLAARDDLVSLWERWRLTWSPDFDAGSIEAARYGPTLADAAAAVLAERAAALERDAAAAALLLLDAALAGLTELAWALRQRVTELTRGEGDFFNLAVALGHLLYLYRHDSVLRTAGSEPVGALLREAYGRALWLLEGLGDAADRERQVIDGVAAVRDAFERCELALDLDRAELIDVLTRVGADPARGGGVRGAALGARWSLGGSDADAVRGQLRQFTDADRLGDFLTGLFALAREQVQRQPGLVLAIHEAVSGWSGEDFLHALPALRLAFTYFTPREKHHLALTLREALGLDPRIELTALDVDAAAVARAVAFEDRLFRLADRCGLRGDGYGRS